MPWRFTLAYPLHGNIQSKLVRLGKEAVAIVCVDERSPDVLAGAYLLFHLFHRCRARPHRFGPFSPLLLSYKEGLRIVILVDLLAYTAVVIIPIARNLSFVVRVLVIFSILYAIGFC